MRKVLQTRSHHWKRLPAVYPLPSPPHSTRHAASFPTRAASPPQRPLSSMLAERYDDQSAAIRLRGDYGNATSNSNRLGAAHSLAAPAPAPGAAGRASADGRARAGTAAAPAARPYRPRGYLQGEWEDEQSALERGAPRGRMQEAARGEGADLRQEEEDAAEEGEEEVIEEEGIVIDALGFRHTAVSVRTLHRLHPTGTLLLLSLALVVRGTANWMSSATGGRFPGSEVPTRKVCVFGSTAS